MNEPTAFTMPAKVEAPAAEGKLYLIEFDIRCPICGGWWKLQVREKIARLSSIQGAVEGAIRVNGTIKSIRVDSSRWGTQALCGTDFARRIAVIKTGNRVNMTPWKDQDEREMHGRLKYRQNEYHAWATAIKLADGTEELIDEQRARRTEILGRQNTLISQDRLKALGLEGWEWKTAT